MRRAALDEFYALPLGAETEHLALIDLGERGRVVDFGDVDVLRRQPRHLVGLARGDVRKAGLVERTVLPAGQHARPNLDRAVAHLGIEALEIVGAADEHRGGAVADRRAHRTSERIRDDAILEYRFGRHLEAVLRLRIERAI